jgi:hypothetical protein
MRSWQAIKFADGSAEASSIFNIQRLPEKGAGGKSAAKTGSASQEDSGLGHKL